MNSRIAWLAAVTTIVAAGVVAMPSLPLGIPGEWVWGRIPFLYDGLGTALIAMGVVAAAAIGYVVFVWYGASRFVRCSRAGRAGWLVLLVLFAGAWQWCVLAQPPSDHRLTKLAWVPYYQKFAGYFHIARFQIHDVRVFLRTYEARMSEGDVLHIGTHPPGLVLYHYGLIKLCQESSTLRSWLLATQPEVIQETFAETIENQSAYGITLRPEDRAAIWLGVLIFQFAVIATVLPLYGLLREFYDSRTSWLGAAIWPLIPAPIVFLPKSDVVFPLITASFLLAWLIMLRRRSITSGILAGLTLFLGMLLSLAFLPIVLIAFALLVWELGVPKEEHAEKRRGWTVLASSVAVGAFFFCVLLFLKPGGVCLFRVWMWNLSNHGDFYQEYDRTYWKWVLVNPIELAMAIGPAIMVCCLASIAGGLRQGIARTEGLERFASTFLLTWVVLWLSGKNSGEAARLWILFHPLLVVIAAGCFQRPQIEQDRSAGDNSLATPQLESERSNRGLLALLAVQAVYCVVVVTLFDGFELYSVLKG